MKISKKITTVAMLFLLSLLSMTALGQGLEEATDAVQEFQDWMYVILGCAVGRLNRFYATVWLR